MSTGNVVVSQDAPAKNNLWIQPRGTARFWNGSIWKIIGGGEGETGYLTQGTADSRYLQISTAENTYLTKEFFNKLFRVHTGISNNDNDVTTTIPDSGTSNYSIEAMFGFWTEQYISSLGLNSDQSSSVGIDLVTMWNQLTTNNDDTYGSSIINMSHLPEQIQIAFGDTNPTGYIDRWNEVKAFLDYPENNTLTGILEHKEDKSNKVTSWSQTLSDTKYPSEKLVKNYVDSQLASKLDKAYFNRLFKAHNGSADVSPNDMNTTVDSIEAMFGFWTQQYISSLGQNDEQSSGSGGMDLVTLWNELTNPSGYTSSYENSIINVSHLPISLTINGNGNAITSLSYDNGVFTASKGSTFKTQQNAISDPSASGNSLTFIDSITQNANGVINPTKKNIQTASTSQKGVVQLSSTSSATDETKAATPKGVWAAINTLDYSSPSASSTAISFIDTVSQTDGKISATKKTVRNASYNQSGVVSSGTQTFGGTKTFKNTDNTSGNASVKIGEVTLKCVNIGTNETPSWALEIDKGLYSNSFISALGLNSQSNSGSGGLDIPSLWKELNDTEDGSITVINESHLPWKLNYETTGKNYAVQSSSGSLFVNVPWTDNNTTYKLSLNGTQYGGGSTSLGSFYAPTSAGTSGYILKSNGSGAPSWVAQSNLSVGSASKLTTARKTYVTLDTASTTTTRDWSGDTTIPVSGILSIANGGTGSSNLDKFRLLEKGTLISATSSNQKDFNDYTNIGTYYSAGGYSNSTTMNNMLNKPSGVVAGFKLIVEHLDNNTSSDGYLKQTLYIKDKTSYTRTRYYSSDEFIWTNWVKNITSLDLGSQNRIVKFGSNTFANSIIYENNDKIGICNSAPDCLLTVSGDARISNSLIIGSLSNGAKISWDSINGGLKIEHVVSGSTAGVYADWVSALGANDQQGGSGGGMDITTLWKELTNDDDWSEGTKAVAVSRGGTGVTEFTSGYLLTGNGTSAIQAYQPSWQSWVAGTSAGPKAKIKLGNVDYTSAAIPSASDSASGIVTTGTQSFAGEKSFIGWVNIKNTTTNGSGFRMYFTDKSTSNPYTLIYSYRDANYGGRIRFREYSEDSSGTCLSYHESYDLPRATQGRTGNATYSILTSKSAVTVAQGGTGATSAVAAEYNILGSIQTVETEPNDDRYIALRNQTVNDVNGTFRWTKMTSVWDYLKGKMSSDSAVNISGNAATATKLASSVTLWGQSFDGSSNVSGNITNAGNITSSSTNTKTLGSSSNIWSSVYAKKYYADGTDSGYYANGKPAIYHNGSNLWIGSEATDTNVFTGGLYLNAGNTTDGYRRQKAYLCVGDTATSTTGSNRVIVNGSGGSATQPVYIDSLGRPTSTTYSLSSTINAGTANRLAYYTSDGIDDASTTYVSNTKLAINSTSEPSDNFYVNGTSCFNSTTKVTSTGTNRATFELISNGDYPVDLKLGRSDTAKWSLTARKSTEGDAFYIYSYLQSKTALYIKNDNTLNVGIGTSSPPAKLSVDGNIYASGGVTALQTVTSDKRFKKNIKKFEAKEIIDKLQPVSFEWNSKAKKYSDTFKDGKNYGLIAQDSDGIIDDLVFDLPDGKGYKGVRYEKLIPILLQAIKEQNEKIENLEYEINVLKGVYK